MTAACVTVYLIARRDDGEAYRLYGRRVTPHRYGEDPPPLTPFFTADEGEAKAEAERLAPLYDSVEVVSILGGPGQSVEDVARAAVRTWDDFFPLTRIGHGSG